MYVKLAVVVFVLIVQSRVDATDSADVHDTSSQERPFNVQKRRLSLQDTGRPQICFYKFSVFKSIAL